MPKNDSSPAGSGRSTYFGDICPDLLLQRAIDSLGNLRLPGSALRALARLLERALTSGRREGSISNRAFAKIAGVCQRYSLILKKRLHKAGVIWFERDSAGGWDLATKYRLLFDLPKSVVERFRAWRASRKAVPAAVDEPGAAAPGDDQGAAAPADELRSEGAEQAPADEAFVDELRAEQPELGADEAFVDEQRAEQPELGADEAFVDELRPEQPELGADEACVDELRPEPARADTQPELGAVDEQREPMAPPRSRATSWDLVRSSLETKLSKKADGAKVRVPPARVPEWAPAMDMFSSLTERARFWGRDPDHVASKIVARFVETASETVKLSGYSARFLLRDFGAYVLWYAQTFGQREAAPIERGAPARAAPRPARSLPCEWGVCREPALPTAIEVARGRFELRCAGHVDARDVAPLPDLTPSFVGTDEALFDQSDATNNAAPVVTVAAGCEYETGGAPCTRPLFGAPRVVGDRFLKLCRAHQVLLDQSGPKNGARA